LGPGGPPIRSRQRACGPGTERGRPVSEGRASRALRLCGHPMSTELPGCCPGSEQPTAQRREVENGGLQQSRHVVTVVGIDHRRRLSLAAAIDLRKAEAQAFAAFVRQSRKAEHPASNLGPSRPPGRPVRPVRPPNAVDTMLTGLTVRCGGGPVVPPAPRLPPENSCRRLTIGDIR
jgi:hypothetical protein